MKWKMWDFWNFVKRHAENKMEKWWMYGGNCNSRCVNCKLWESSGNEITTLSLDSDLVERHCKNCGHSWKAVFTPAGFVQLEDKIDE